MGKVFANGMEIAARAQGGKVIAAFPDVCLSPPSPPAGPVPLPYPDTSSSSDMQKGSTSVKIAGGPVMLRDKSYYKTSPLGNEAATRSFGGSVLTHTITGKTYFGAWSMDVTVEGANVPRHLDLTTSNHASYPGGTPPLPNTAEQNRALTRIAKGKCPCCGKNEHVPNTVKPAPATPGAPSPPPPPNPTNIDDWYTANAVRRGKNPADVQALLAKARARPGCVCRSKNTRLLPSPPCDVFFDPPDPARTKAIGNKWRNYRKKGKYDKRFSIKTQAAADAEVIAENHGVAPPDLQRKSELKRQVNHLTPKSAGGCPTGHKNLQANRQLCGPCQAIDAKFSDFQ